MNFYSMYTQQRFEKNAFIAKWKRHCCPLHFMMFFTTTCRQHVLCCAAILSALSTVSKHYHARFIVHFNTDISCTLLELITNYDTSLLVSDVRRNCAASNVANVTSVFTTIVFVSFPRQLRYVAIIFVYLLFKRD